MFSPREAPQDLPLNRKRSACVGVSSQFEHFQRECELIDESECGSRSPLSSVLIVRIDRNDDPHDGSTTFTSGSLAILRHEEGPEGLRYETAIMMPPCEHIRRLRSAFACHDRLFSIDSEHDHACGPPRNDRPVV